MSNNDRCYHMLVRGRGGQSSFVRLIVVLRPVLGPVEARVEAAWARRIVPGDIIDRLGIFEPVLVAGAALG